MGERGCAVASLWLEHAPSIGLAIGPRQRCNTIPKIKFLCQLIQKV